MKITIESTDESIEGKWRVWRGVTESGIPCLVLVSAIATETDEARRAIEPELQTLENRQSDNTYIWYHGPTKL